jgi:hypothetical protein
VEFPVYDFDKMGETDVREEIIAPLLRHLGYRSGTQFDVIREQHLTYSRIQLGREKATDPPLRGKADYICEVRRAIRWVIEAKAPSEDLDALAQRQAWTYANHPEVRAVYFVMVNGRELKLFQTSRGGEAPPLLCAPYADLPTCLAALENLLRPEALERDFPEPVLDTGRPLGPGLRSIARITGGHIRMTKVSTGTTALEQMLMTITEGSIERNAGGGLDAWVGSVVPFQSLQSLNEHFGLDRMHLVSQDAALSTDAQRPSTFESQRRVVIPAGTSILDLQAWKEVAMPMQIAADVATRASGYLDGAVFRGNYSASMQFYGAPIAVELEGNFDIRLA